MDEQSTDVAFKVGEQEEKWGAAKKARTAPTVVYAQRFVLQKCARQLAELCGSGGKETPLPLAHVKPDVFCYLLGYVCWGGSDQ